jgi:hypothetical protein
MARHLNPAPSREPYGKAPKPVLAKHLPTPHLGERNDLNPELVNRAAPCPRFAPSVEAQIQNQNL